MAVAVAAPHPAAVEAAREVVARGGNAFDAALAAAGALTVAYPHQCSAGGDLVAIVRPAGGVPRAVLSIGAAAAGVDIAALRAAGDRMPFDGPQTITVPGVVAGWAAIAGLGARLALSELLAPAIRLATAGVPVSPGLRRAIAGRIDAIRSDPGLSALLLRGDDRLVQPVLAETLTAIGTDWRSFYEGDLARRLAAGLGRLGSPIVAADLAAHRAEVVPPLTRALGEVVWHAAPPPVQGPTFLAVVGADDLLAASHRARQARDARLGDPRTGPIDLDGMLAPDPGRAVAVDGAADGRRGPGTGAVRSDSAQVGPKPAGDTVAVTAVDDDGIAVTLIQSVFGSFGSGLLDPGTGLVLHNRGSSFRLEPDHPGRIAPGSRPPHTLCPTMALTGGDVLALGCQGGRNQPWILAQVAGEALGSDDLPGLLTRPRWFFDGTAVVTEPGVDALVDDAGHVQVSRLRAGRLASASDPRADGRAAVLPG
ncbi:gamma-glutamyltransferase [Actinoplanes sp. KI2]|uniref:gamma-glutamyltransferase n=1 Tax=Actinoplanes sp. KI2 TaxID=2983315 RepID=UPI0021D6046D|nr:gamma-glutamyltransferase [Actinoplanes sp. KI2]MCU7726812.1 gamma-glutamyltransferase [Actinoplanes sp. KI2]